MNSAVDNPLVFLEEKKVAHRKRTIGGATVPGVVLSGGNFHGEPLAFALDFMAIALSALAASQSGAGASGDPASMKDCLHFWRPAPVSTPAS